MSNEIQFPAFPVTAGHEVYCSGIMIRDYIALMAMQGLMAKDIYVFHGNIDHEEIAKVSYKMADAMLKEGYGND